MFHIYQSYLPLPQSKWAWGICAYWLDKSCDALGFCFAASTRKKNNNKLRLLLLFFLHFFKRNCLLSPMKWAEWNEKRTTAVDGYVIEGITVNNLWAIWIINIIDIFNWRKNKIPEIRSKDMWKIDDAKIKCFWMSRTWLYIRYAIKNLSF